VQEHILSPLGMKDSTLLKKEANPSLLTTPHVLDDELEPKVSEAFPYNRMHSPSSTLISNVHDMSRWAMANLNRGELDGKRILKESSYDIMWRPSSEKFPQIGMSCQDTRGDPRPGEEVGSRPLDGSHGFSFPDGGGAARILIAVILLRSSPTLLPYGGDAGREL